MDLARELAERGRYTAAPNPLVGAVITRGGEVVGKGWHVRAGSDHAEVAALESVDSPVAGATMYVTLEPCNHHGRTPPCTEAIVRAGISKVVVGHLDPDPRMRGRSVGLLREAGIEVEVRDDPVFEHQNERFFTAVRKGRPHVHLKLAATLDGRIAASNGDSKWVTGEASRRRARMLRAEAGAVLVGAGTVRADDPQLTARDLPEEPPQVLRAVLDPNLTIGRDSQLAKSSRETPVTVFTGKNAEQARADELEAAGVNVVDVPESGGELDLEAVLDELHQRGVRGLLVEGGGETAAGFVKKGLVDKLTVFYAPKLLGAEGVPMIGKMRLTRMAEASGFEISGVEVLEGELIATLRPLNFDEEVYVHRAS